MADFDTQVAPLAHREGKEPVFRDIPADRLRLRHYTQDYTTLQRKQRPAFLPQFCILYSQLCFDFGRRGIVFPQFQA